MSSHILPWSTHEAERLNVRNGICLNRLHDAAFDQGLIAFDDECRMLVSTQLNDHLPQHSIRENFAAYERTALHLPQNGILPDPEHLRWHRSKIYCGNL